VKESRKDVRYVNEKLKSKYKRNPKWAQKSQKGCVRLDFLYGGRGKISSLEGDGGILGCP
jgi:hypothetical protein